MEDWQHECCGDPFAIGDEVSWTVYEDETGEWREDHHDGAPPASIAVTGTVRRIQVVEQDFEEFEPRTWRPLPGTRGYADVDAMPDVLTTEIGLVRRKTGALVDVAVSDRDASGRAACASGPA